ncbi:hypothetical protein DPMN_092854 [Dreissena polymorpha]|uniref:Uncharacterized protein n=1 Tax=Dreissena polymorpha TaxID=45954 RepID=A0A9D4L322_DREPO|nr:hypothetical protein DPMN_092854 [Dreissena polymorpha]
MSLQFSDDTIMSCPIRRLQFRDGNMLSCPIRRLTEWDVSSGMEIYCHVPSDD